MSKGSKGKKGNGIISFGLGGRSKSKDDDDSTIRTSTMPPVATYTPTPSSMNIRSDSLGYNPSGHHHSDVKIESLTFTGDESEAFRAYAASQHYYYRGHFWNAAKSEIMKRYINLTFIGITQGLVAYFTNYTAKNLIDNKFDRVTETVIAGKILTAFLYLFVQQILYAAWASSAVMIEPMSGGSGIPEVKCFLNGVDLPRINNLRTGICKVLGVIGSVAAGLPVGKEGPMVHSGAVVAATVSSGRVKDDKKRRDYVAAGAAAGVCTAFSAPIGGFLFAFEEGASYWSQSLTFRTFYTSAWAIATLYILGSVGVHFGQIGFEHMFSFGNFIFEGRSTSYAMWELPIFICIGIAGGLVGAIFNDTNERITKLRIKYVNHTKHRRFIEVLCISALVSICMFGLPYLTQDCLILPDAADNEQQMVLIGRLNRFTCEEGYYNPLASLFLADGNDAIKMLFHMHQRTFPFRALILFFTFYISLATITYGIAVPSGLFVPSLLAGAAFGRLIGNVIYKITPLDVAFSNVYSLIGAAAVLGGMARMTISLTVILLECTGNEQYVLPLMISLFTARVVGSLFNTDLYHIHIHMKNGVQFLDHELRSISGQHNLYAGHIMSTDVVFVRPIERVGVVYDILTTTDHSQFPVVDTDDRDILYGTINRNALLMLLQSGAYGTKKSQGGDSAVMQNHVQLDPFEDKYVPLIPYKTLEQEYGGLKVEDVRVSDSERDLLMDLRPYCNTAPHTVQETTSVNRSYELFRALGLRILVVVNRYNQCVGTISRDDLVPEALAQNMIMKGKHV